MRLIHFVRKLNMAGKLIVGLALLVAPIVAAANCYSIRDQDLRNQCLATTKGSSSYCYSIRDPDMKNLCMARVRGSRSYCYSIRDDDTKNLCLAEVK